MHTKRHLLALLALAGLGLTAHAQTAATDWPNKPIRWVVWISATLRFRI